MCYKCDVATKKANPATKSKSQKPFSYRPAKHLAPLFYDILEVSKRTKASKNGSHVTEVKIDEPGDTFVVKQLGGKQPEIRLRQPMRLFVVVGDGFPVEEIHRCGHHALEKIPQTQACVSFQHREQIGIHEIELLAFAGALPSFRAEDCAGGKLIAVLAEIVFNFARLEQLPVNWLLACL